MKCMMLKMVAILLAAACIIQAPMANAKCADYMRPADFPSEITTQNGTKLIYSYQFGEDETYTISWANESVSGGPIGPYALQPGCKVPEISEESNEFLLLEKGCGTFCWYFDVLGLRATGNSSTGSYEQVELPLAFDEARNLLAYYPRKDFIAIKNLSTGYEQIFATEHVCDTGMGLCFRDVTFTPDSLIYTWESPTGVGPGEQLNQPLDNALIKQ